MSIIYISAVIKDGHYTVQENNNIILKRQTTSNETSTNQVTTEW